MVRLCLSWLSLFGDLLRLLALGLRSKTSLAAENLFLRKQLAFYQQNQASPNRQSNPPDARVAQPTLQLAKRLDRRDAQDLRQLASQRLPAFLALEMPIRPAAYPLSSNS
jgi:hypothetical protein